ncbi:acyloxyacyl hydrolase [Devosia soli]|uniref:acyloxyacyl hydrolase n=1 Tax=Devosia soli TaxID=361041 RepID=UPI0006994B97|nr:acyloxyacyl hydrolase [Devosia soli]
MIARTPSRLMPLLMLALLAVPAAAQVNILPEVRGGVAMRDIGRANAQLFDPAQIRDLNVELLFAIPDLNAWNPIGELRPHLGATVNLEGRESLAYGGLSWTFRAPVVPVFIEAGLGGALHSGSFQATPSRFGCAVLAEAQASVGVEILPGTSLMATLQHATDFGLCGKAADGLTTAGLRLGVRF